MKYLIYFLLAVALIAVPVSAAEVSEPLVTETAPLDDDGEYPALYAVDSPFSGGYYFVADCILGTELKFYVPVEWAYDRFAVNDIGSLVNMSNSTCYVYCPDFPDYTFSASRFGTFVYRGDGYNSADLALTNVTDTNLELLQDEAVRLSDSNVLFGILCVLFLFFGFYIIRRR